MNREALLDPEDLGAKARAKAERARIGDVWQHTETRVDRVEREAGEFLEYPMISFARGESSAFVRRFPPDSMMRSWIKLSLSRGVNAFISSGDPEDGLCTLAPRDLAHLLEALESLTRLELPDPSVDTPTPSTLAIDGGKVEQPYVYEIVGTELVKRFPGVGVRGEALSFDLISRYRDKTSKGESLACGPPKKKFGEAQALATNYLPMAAYYASGTSFLKSDLCVSNGRALGISWQLFSGREEIGENASFRLISPRAERRYGLAKAFKAIRWWRACGSGLPVFLVQKVKGRFAVLNCKLTCWE